MDCILKQYFTTIHLRAIYSTHDAGLLRQPKWGHLKDLHRAIKLCEPALVSGNPIVTRLGNYQEVNIFFYLQLLVDESSKLNLLNSTYPYRLMYSNQNPVLVLRSFRTTTQDLTQRCRSVTCTTIFRLGLLAFSQTVKTQYTILQG